MQLASVHVHMYVILRMYVRMILRMYIVGYVYTVIVIEYIAMPFVFSHAFIMANRLIQSLPNNGHLSLCVISWQNARIHVHLLALTQLTHNHRKPEVILGLLPIVT